MEAASFFSSSRPISAIEGHEEIESVEKKQKLTAELTINTPVASVNI